MSFKSKILFTLISLLTILIGVFVFKDQQYYLISSILIIYTLIMVMSGFENKKNTTSKLVTISVLIALAVAGRIGFSFLPQFKPAAAIIIIIAVCFGADIGFMSGAMTGFISNFFFGQGPWTPWQMFSLALIGLFAGLIFYNKDMKHRLLWLCIYGAISTIIIYGGIMNPVSVMIVEPRLTVEAVMVSYAVGIHFDIIHAIATVVFLSVLAIPMIKLINRVKLKYDLL